MAEPNPHVVEVGERDFQAAVVERSKQVPVLVDFWAPWCAPCRMLGPTLERLAAELDGAFVLAKVNSDDNPALSQRFGVRGIPNVKLFRDGAVADEFVGALPESQVRQFLARNIPSEADELAGRAAEQLQAGAIDDAVATLERAIAADPNHAASHLALARIALARGDADAVDRHVSAIPPLAPEADVAGHLRDAAAFAAECRDAGGEQACRDRLTSAPDDLDSRYALGCCLAAAGRYPEALEELLACVAADKRHRDEAARKAMLTIFGLVGVRSELSDGYRRKLAIYL